MEKQSEAFPDEPPTDANTSEAPELGDESHQMTAMEDTQLVQFVHDQGFEPPQQGENSYDISVVHLHITDADGGEGVHVLHVPVSALQQQGSYVQILPASTTTPTPTTSLDIKIKTTESCTPTTTTLDVTTTTAIKSKPEAKIKKSPLVKKPVKRKKKVKIDLPDEEPEEQETIASVVKQKKRSASEKLTLFLNRHKAVVKTEVEAQEVQDKPLIPPPSQEEKELEGPEESKNNKTEGIDNPEDKADNDNQEITKTVPEFPTDRCANCYKEIQDSSKQSTIHPFHFDSPIYPTKKDKPDDKPCSTASMPIIEVLHFVFQIPTEFRNFSEELFLCQECSQILQVLYTVFKDFTELTEESSYVLRKWEEINKLLIKRRRNRNRKKKMEVIDVDELMAEEEEWITADFSEDEDFQASEGDLAAVGLRSSSSASDSDSYVPVRKKRLHAIKNRKSRSGGGPLSENYGSNDDGQGEGGMTSDDDFTNSDNKPRSRRRRYKSHKNTLQAQLKYVCNLCDENFSKPRELKRHLQEFHKATQLEFLPEEEPEEQDTSDEKKRSLEVHEESQSQDTEISAIECRICGKLLDKTELKGHFSQDHEGHLPFPCLKCERAFWTEGALKNHEVKHKSYTPYKCKECSEAFRRADELRIHFRNEHYYGADGEDKKSRRNNRTEKSIMFCEVCGKSFVRQDHLTLHLRIHTGEKPFCCEFPGCSKKFSDPRGLAYHEVTHSNERPYCCTICGQTFKRLHHLNDHERNHRADFQRLFACDICGKSFKYKKHLNSHKVTHGTAKDHTCEVCGKSFNRKDNLRQHVKKVHGKEPGPDTMSSFNIIVPSTIEPETTTILTTTDVTATDIVYMTL